MASIVTKILYDRAIGRYLYNGGILNIMIFSYVVVRYFSCQYFANLCKCIHTHRTSMKIVDSVYII